MPSAVATVFRSLIDAGLILLNLLLGLVGGVAGVLAGGGLPSVALIIDCPLDR